MFALARATQKAAHEGEILLPTDTLPVGPIADQIPPPPNKNPKRDSGVFLTILFGLIGVVFYALQSNGVGANWTWSAVIYAGSTVGVVWTTLRHAPLERSAGRYFVSCLFAVLILALGSIGTARQYSKDHAPVPVADAPTLLVQYTESELPIEIPAMDSAYVLQLNPLITDQTFEITNPTKKKMWWPEKPRTKDEFPLGPMYICRITNHGDKSLLNVSMVFKLSFASVEPEHAWVTKHSDGTMSVSADSPGEDRIMFAQALPGGEILSGKSGSVVSSHNHVVTIPAIEAHGTATLYLVPQTDLFSSFIFPEKATAIVDGNPAQRTAVIVRPAMSPMDTTKFWMMPPSLYVWPGVKDSILEAAIPWANKGEKASHVRRQ